MKLLSCYVEGYGKIKGQEYTFVEGINAFCQDNGEGKTTLASFIKAMFYGLPSYDKRSNGFCDREHFYPFDGGKFGGNLTFEAEGKIYKIVRFFGEKREKEDTFLLYIDGELQENADGEIGKRIFEVDKASFERTVFFDSGEVEMGSTSSIQARLNRVLEGGEDTDIDLALKKLEEAAKVYKKSKGGNDKITAETANIAVLNEKLENARKMQLALEEKYARADALTAEIKALNEKISFAQARNERLTQFEHYDSLLAGVEEAERECEKISLRYPSGLPTKEETDEFNAYMVASKELDIQKNSARFSAQDEERLSLLSAQFQGKIPTEEKLLEIEREIEGLAKIEAEGKGLAALEEEETVRAVKGKFAYGAPSKEVLKETEEKLERYKKLQREMEATPALLQATGKKSISKKYTVTAVFALLLCLVGGLGFLFSTPLAIAGLCFGGGLLVVDGFLYLNHKSGVGVAIENPERKGLERALLETEDSIKAILMPYGYYTGNGLAYDFATFKDGISLYERAIAADKARAEQSKRLAERQSAANDKLLAFFRGFGLSGDAYSKLFTLLQVRMNDYKALKTRKQEATEKESALVEKERALAVKREAYCRKYRLQNPIVEEILEDVRSYTRFQKRIAEGKAQALAYEKEKGLGARDEGERLDLGALQAELSEKQSEKGRLSREIDADEQEIELLSGSEAEKKIAEERLKEYKKKHKLLEATATLIKRADGQLRDKYVRPIKEEFLRYASLIEETLGEKVVMTKEFEVRFERGGEERSEKHLSSGQKSVCALCLRLALIRHMYRERLPFLVLDDPFVGLDATHIKRVSAVLKELSKEMQMIYFTCHESRSI